MRDNQSKAGKLSSVARALQVLDTLREEEPLGVTEIARRLDLSPATVHRILVTLAEANYVRQPVPNGKYYVGLMLSGSAELAAVDHCVEVALPRMESLRDDSGETIHLVRLQQRQVQFVAGMDSRQPMRVTSRVGRLMPAHATAGGKLLLALRPADEIAALYDGIFDGATPRTIGDLGALRVELARTRDRGFGTNYSEAELGVAALAVPIHRPSRTVLCALTLTGPEARFDGGGPPGSHIREAEFLAMLRAAVAEIEANLRF